MNWGPLIFGVVVYGFAIGSLIWWLVARARARRARQAALVHWSALITRAADGIDVAIAALDEEMLRAAATPALRRRVSELEDAHVALIAAWAARPE